MRKVETPAVAKVPPWKYALAGVGVLVLIVAIASGIGAVVEARNKPRSLDIPPAYASERPARFLDRQYQVLQEHYGLTREQRRQIEAVLQESVDRGVELFNADYDSGLERLMRMRAARAELDRRIEEILTPEQRERYREERMMQQQAVNRILNSALEAQRGAR